MLPVDSYTLLLASVVFAVALTLLLVVTQIGMGSAGRGLGLWMAGDLALMAAQFAAYADAPGSPVALPLSGWTLTTVLVCTAINAHTVAVRRIHLGRPGLRVAALLILLPTLVFGSISWHLPDEWTKELAFRALMVIFGGIQVWQTLPPARRFWGARLLVATSSGGAVLNAALAMELLAAPHVPRGIEGPGQLVMLAITLLTTSSVLLWLQERLRDRLTQVAMTDALTGALNRHGVMPLLERELQRARRHGRPVSIVLCDLDHFKRVNDQHGHQTGDAVLCRFVRETRAMLRGGDLLARWGGEEFLVVLPETAMAEAVLVAERVRQAQRRAAGDGLPPVTVSGGVATAPGPVHGYDVDTLLAVADHRLYVAKETRDRIVSTGLAAAPAGAGQEAAAPVLVPLAAGGA